MKLDNFMIDILENSKYPREQAIWMLNNGFNRNCYCIFCLKGRTYPYKDQLKAAGWKYSKILGWNGPICYEYPVDKLNVEMYFFDDLYEWSPQHHKAFLKKDNKGGFKIH